MGTKTKLKFYFIRNFKLIYSIQAFVLMLSFFSVLSKVYVKPYKLNLIHAPFFYIFIADFILICLSVYCFYRSCKPNRD